MTEIRCGACGHRFETAAKSNRTRCPACRSTVAVPAGVRRENGWDGATAAGRNGASAGGEHRLGLVLLDCGHPEVVVLHPGRTLRGTLKLCDFECPDTNTAVAVRRTLAVLSEQEWAALTDADVDALVEAASAGRP